MNDSTRVPLEVTEDAAEWFARLQLEQPSKSVRMEFVNWLRRSPVHVEEFLRVSSIHRALSTSLKTDGGWLPDVLAEASTLGDNVVRLAEVNHDSPPKVHRPSSRQRRLFVAAAAAVVLAIGIGSIIGITIFLPAEDPHERFITQIGEQRWITLSDGSHIQLNTDTEILVRMGRRTREVTLVKGEAIFDVEEDPARPFRVMSDTAQVEAVGTRFNVYRQQEQTIITVVEGRVVVSALVKRENLPDSYIPVDDDGPTTRTDSTVPTSDHVPGAPLQVDAGSSVAVTTGGDVVRPESTDVESATDWTRRRRVFDSDTLETVVAEFNRYNREQLVIADGDLASRRITGIFNIDDTGAFLALLGELDDIRIERRADGNREIRRSLPPSG